MGNKTNKEWEDRLVQSGCSIYEDNNSGQTGYTIIIPIVDHEEELERIFSLILDWSQDKHKNTNLEGGHHDPGN